VLLFDVDHHYCSNARTLSSFLIDGLDGDYVHEHTKDTMT